MPHFLRHPGLSPQQSSRRGGRRPGGRLAPSSTGPQGECISQEGPVPSCSGGHRVLWREVEGIPIAPPLIGWCQSRRPPGSQLGVSGGLPVWVHLSGRHPARLHLTFQPLTSVED